jgi:PAS domain S-box-containing protein
MTGASSPEAAATSLAQPRRASSLRARLMLLVILAVSPLVLFDIGYQYKEYKDDVARTIAETLSDTRSMSLQVEKELQARIAVLGALATAGNLQLGNLDQFRARAEAIIADQFPGAVIELLTLDGQEIVNTSQPKGAPPLTRANLDSLKQVLATGQPVVSDVFVGGSPPGPVVAIDVPVRRADGSILYVLSLHPRLEVFADIIHSQDLSKSWRIAVFDRKGITVARYPNGEEFVGKPASDAIVKMLLQQHEGNTENISREGISVISVFNHDDRFGWAVAIGVPKWDLINEVVRGATLGLIIDVAMLVIGLILAAYAARRIAGPISTLRRIASSSGDHLPPEPTPTGLLEVDEVAMALHQTDIERQRSRAAEILLRESIASIPEGFAIFDPADRLVMCNQGYRELFPGDPARVVEGTLFDEMVRSGIQNRDEALVAARVRDHRDPGTTIEQRLADGRWVLVRNRQLHGGGLAGLRIDITPLKIAERQLNQAQQLAHLGSFTVDIATGDQTWSDEMYRIYGVSRDTFVPTMEALLQAVHPEDRAKLLASRDAVLRSSHLPALEFRIVRPDGSVREVYRELEVILDEDGNAVSYAGALQDITDRRRTEDQLRQAQKMEAIGNLTGGMAHDFNNLLGVVVGNLDLARERAHGNDEVRELVEEALEAAWHGADLNRRLLAFARRQPLRPSRTDINELVSNTARLLRRLLGEDIEVLLALGKDLHQVVVDPAQLESAIANLANNARDAMPEGGRLTISTSNRDLDAGYAASHPDVTPGQYAMIEISDTGTGMPPEIMSQIFEPFFTTKEQGKGTGLGLSMVFGFLRQSRGHVSVYSEVGVGTTFRLYLPRATAEEVAIEVVESRRVERGVGETILVVEDNAGMRRIVLRQLRDLGYNVLDCDRAAAALEILQRERVDLLFTDIVMPGGLDGVELARLARERLPNLKIILTSGFPQAHVNGDGGIAAELHLLSKPYSTEALAAAFRAAFEGK